MHTTPCTAAFVTIANVKLSLQIYTFYLNETVQSTSLDTNKVMFCFILFLTDDFKISNDAVVRL